MYCGIFLAGDTDDDSTVAFIGENRENTETFSVSTNDEIMDLLEERRPEVVALNAPPKHENREGFRSGEEELVEEGHSLLPQGMRKRAVLERADHLSRSIEMSGIGTTIVETNADIASEILGLEGDEDLQDWGIEVSGIETVWEYDAVVLAVVAKLYADNRCEDYGLVVPEEDAGPI